MIGTTLRDLDGDIPGIAGTATIHVFGPLRGYGAAVDRVRLCSRPACAEPATATLSYDYAGRTVWLDDLEPERPPSTYDLCPRHADRLGVPMGWRREDRRVIRSLIIPDRLAV